LGSIGLVVWRRDLLRTEHQLGSLMSREAVFLLQNMVLVALTAVIFWLTFFPLISEAITGTQVAVGPPVFERFVVPLALVVVLLTGIGPIIPWRRVTLAKLRRSFAFPVAVGVIALAGLAAVSGVTVHLYAYLMFGFGAFALATVAQEFQRGIRARRATSGESPPRALAALVRRNRRRYGGYIVHAGVAVAMIGVAASTSFLHQRDATIKPGQSVKVDGYTVRYVRATASATAQKISLGAVLSFSKGGHRVTTMHTSYGLYPAQNDPMSPVGRFFNGAHETQVGLDSTPYWDLWAAVAPNVTPLQSMISRGDVLVAQALLSAEKLPAAQRAKQLNLVWGLRDDLIRALTQRFVSHPWASTFRIEESPLVMWLWVGALIAALGGLIALSPPWPGSRRRAPVPARRPLPAPAPGAAPAPSAAITASTHVHARELA
ncbi:MAG: cytochrome c-type biogenesis CcmF C-terminal domain-containing protein, partial [Solirubrobacteraceae bacterium]